MPYEMTLVDILTAIVHLQVVGCIFYGSKRVLKLSVKTIFNALLDIVPVLPCTPLERERERVKNCENWFSHLGRCHAPLERDVTKTKFSCLPKLTYPFSPFRPPMHI